MPIGFLVTRSHELSLRPEARSGEPPPSALVHPRTATPSPASTVESSPELNPGSSPGLNYADGPAFLPDSASLARQPRPPPSYRGVEPRPAEAFSRAAAILRSIGRQAADPCMPLGEPTSKEANQGARPMKREQLAEKILDIKREKGWTWKYITDEIGGMSPVLVVGALLGQMKLVKPLAAKAAALFGLSPNEERLLNEVPHRGTPMPPTDPLIYRFYELVMVNGPAWKALIEEEFGDGIMSAIDFDIEIERLPNPKGDRVKITMSGKFLPYKYYGNEQGIQDYGLKEA
jgi:cyanate lyase